MKFYKSFSRSIYNSLRNILGIKPIYYLRNLLNIKPIYWNFSNLKNKKKSYSCSDAFPWRTDNNFITKFKFTDILNTFYNHRNSFISLFILDKNGIIIKNRIIRKINKINEFVIDKHLLDGLESYGTFYIFHHSKKKIEKTIIANRCYVGFSKSCSLFSYTHGNTYVSYAEINNFNLNKIKKSFFNNYLVLGDFKKNNLYNIQKIFDIDKKNELFFTNPLPCNLKLKINNHKFFLKPRSSLLISINSKVVNIESNCMWLRPTIFSYKMNFFDVQHS